MLSAAALVLAAAWVYAALRKAWGKGADRRLAGARAQSRRHGGRFVLERKGPKARGPADPEFGPLLVEIPRRLGRGGARFYERGLTLDGTRVSYGDLRDVVFLPSSGLGLSMERKLRESAVLWLRPREGPAIGLRDLSYRFDNETMERIQMGLGFRPEG